MGIVRPRCELGVELRGDEVGVAGYLDDLHEAVVGGYSARHQPCIRQGSAVPIVDFPAVAVSFIHDRFLIELAGQRAVGQSCWIHSEAHRTAHVFDIVLVHHQVDDRVQRCRIEFGAVGVVPPKYIARELDHGTLQTETEAEVWDSFFAGVANGVDFALDPPDPEPSGDDDPVETFEV